MKVLDKGKWIGIFSVLAVIAVIGLAADMLVSSALYISDDTVERILYRILPAVPIAMCSLASAVMMNCRNTRATRNKNRMLNLAYGLLTLVFAFAAAYYPFFGAKGESLIVIALIAAVIAVAAFFISTSVFRETYQKIAATEMAKMIIASTLIIAVVCAVTLLIPQKLSYDAMQMNIARTGKTTGPFKTTVPFIPFSTASAPVLIYLVSLKDVLPKLKFSGKLLFAAVCVWMLIVIVGSAATGRIFLSNAAFGSILGFVVVLITSKFAEKSGNQ